MYNIKINNKYNFEIAELVEKIMVNGDYTPVNIFQIDENRFHILKENRSYNLEIVLWDKAAKKAKISINGNIYDIDIKDQFDILLKKMGLNNLNSQVVKEIKAPMPGLVLKITVKEGETVLKGDKLLVLEAMKMENSIKSPVDAVIKSIKIIVGNKVEKNQLLLSFV